MTTIILHFLKYNPIKKCLHLYNMFLSLTSFSLSIYHLSGINKHLVSIFVFLSNIIQERRYLILYFGGKKSEFVYLSKVVHFV